MSGDEQRPPTLPPLSWYTTRAPDLPAPRELRRARRRRRALDALGCLALAALCFSQATSETLFRADRGFFNRLPLSGATLDALILNLLAVAAIGVAVIEATRRSARTSVRRLAALAATMVLLLGVNFARLTYAWLGILLDPFGRTGAIAVVVLALGVAALWPWRTLREMRRVALALSPLGAFVLVHALWMFLEVAAGPVWRQVDPTPLKTPPPSLRRVVWLVWSRLDPGIAFETRPPGVDLPEFDRFRRDAVYADAAAPAGPTPEIAMAALTTGRRVVAARPVSPYDLELTFADGKSARWSVQPNVFSRARVFGYDSAIVGWGLPYPRVLGASLGAGDWRPSAAYEQTRGDTVGRALVNQWQSLAPPLHARRLTLDRFAELGDLALRTAADARFGLVLLHLPLPEPPAIYDAATGRVTTWNVTGPEAEYLDNLALTDRVVGELRHALDRARLGDRTWVVLTSDRAWHGDRVPFLVRAPEGGHAAHVDGPFDTRATQDLVLAILRGSVTDLDAAIVWLSRYHSAASKE